MGRQAPDPLGVLSHFDAVIWYTGDDYLTREPGQVPGTGTSRLALDEVVAVRDYLNEGGKVFLGGKHAGQEFFEGYEFRNEGFPQPNEDKHGSWCDADLPEAKDGCIAHTNDFFQYYLGAYLRVEDGGSWDDASGDVRPVVGTAPFTGTWTPGDAGGDPSAGAPTSTLASTSSLLARRRTTTSPRSSRTGTGSRPARSRRTAAASTCSRAATTRRTSACRRRSTCRPEGGTLTFWTSFDIEQDWDYFFVEAAPAGTDEWTTLPDVNGHTSDSGGESCHDGTGWGEDLHSRLLNYQTDAGTACDPTGTTGSGTRPPARPAAGSSGRSTSARTRVRQSTSRWCTRRTGAR